MACKTAFDRQWDAPEETWETTADSEERTNQDLENLQRLKDGFQICKFSGGSIYEGNISNGTMHGKGKVIYPNGDLYEGSFDSNRKHGRGMYASATLGSYDGEWVHDVKTGSGKASLANGDEYEGEFVDGKYHGKGHIVHRDGREYTGDFVMGRKQGKGKIISKNKDVYEGDVVDGKMCGVGVMTYTSTKRTYEGTWKDNKRVQGKMTYLSEGRSYDGDWMDGKPDGQGVARFASGDVYTGQWAQARMHGHGLMKYADGREYDGEWKADKYHGRGKFISSSGKVVDTIWEEGVQKDPSLNYAVSTDEGTASASPGQPPQPQLPPKRKSADPPAACGPDNNELEKLLQEVEVAGLTAVAAAPSISQPPLASAPPAANASFSDRTKATKPAPPKKGKPTIEVVLDDDEDDLTTAPVVTADQLLASTKRRKVAFSTDSGQKPPPGDTTGEGDGLAKVKNRPRNAFSISCAPSTRPSNGTGPAHVELTEEEQALLEGIPVESAANLRLRDSNDESRQRKETAPATSAVSKQAAVGDKGPVKTNTTTNEPLTTAEALYTDDDELNSQLPETRPTANSTADSSPCAMPVAQPSLACSKKKGALSAQANGCCKGWLQKYSIGKSLFAFHNWKRRFFMLEDGVLRYFAEDPDVKPNGSRDPLGVVPVSAETTRLVTMPSKKTHKEAKSSATDFVIIFSSSEDEGKEQKLLLRAEGEEDKVRWIDAMYRVVSVIDDEQDAPLEPLSKDDN